MASRARRKWNKKAFLPRTRLRDETSERSGRKVRSGPLSTPWCKVSSECWERNSKTCHEDEAKYHGKRSTNSPLSVIPYNHCSFLNYSRKPWMTYLCLILPMWTVALHLWMSTNNLIVFHCLLSTVSAIHTLVSTYQSPHSTREGDQILQPIWQCLLKPNTNLPSIQALLLSTETSCQTRIKRTSYWK